MYVGDNFGFVDDDVVVVPVGACPTVILTVKSEAARPYTYDRNKASPSPSQNEPAEVPAEAPSDMTWSGGLLNVVRQLGHGSYGVVWEVRDGYQRMAAKTSGVHCLAQELLIIAMFGVVKLESGMLPDAQSVVMTNDTTLA